MSFILVDAYHGFQSMKICQVGGIVDPRSRLNDVPRKRLINLEQKSSA